MSPITEDSETRRIHQLKIHIEHLSDNPALAQRRLQMMARLRQFEDDLDSHKDKDRSGAYLYPSIIERIKALEEAIVTTEDKANLELENRRQQNVENKKENSF